MSFSDSQIQISSSASFSQTSDIAIYLTTSLIIPFWQLSYFKITCPTGPPELLRQICASSGPSYSVHYITMINLENISASLASSSHLTSKFCLLDLANCAGKVCVCVCVFNLSISSHLHCQGTRSSCEVISSNSLLSGPSTSILGL